MNILLSIIASAIYLSLPGITTLITFKLHEEMDIIEFITSALFLSLMIESLLPTAILYLGVSRDLLIPAVITYTIVMGTISAIQIKKEGFKLKKSSKEDLKILIPSIILTTLLAIHLYKYPIFHATMSRDPAVHTKYIQQLLMENPRDTIEKINYPLGLHIIIVQLTLLTNIHPIYTVRYFAAYLTVLTIPLIYIMTRKLFNRDTAFWSTITYQLVFLVSYGHFSVSGMYANILGDIYTIFIIYWWSFSKNLNLGNIKSIGTNFITFFLGISALWAHYSTFIILTLLPLSFTTTFIIQVILLNQESSHHKYNALFISLLWIPILILLLSYQKLLFNILNIFHIIKGEPMLIYRENPIIGITSAYLSNIKILNYLLIFTNIHFYIIIASLIYLIYLAITIKSKFLNYFLILLWSIYIVIWSFQGGSVIRLTIQLILPLSISYSILLSKIYNVLISIYSYTIEVNSYGILYKKLLFIFLISLLLTSGFVPEILSHFRDLSFSRKKQFDILSSIFWINSHLPHKSKILSIGLKEYGHYFNTLTSDYYDYKGDTLPVSVSEFNKIVNERKVNYIVIWKYLHIGTTYLTDEIKKYGKYILIYQNDNIEIFYLIR